MADDFDPKYMKLLHDFDLDISREINNVLDPDEIQTAFLAGGVLLKHAMQIYAMVLTDDAIANVLDNAFETLPELRSNLMPPNRETIH